MYCRWEYIDRNVFRIQSAWTVNPDGTNPQIFYSSQSTYPDMILGAMKIPQTDKYIFMSSSHHNVFRSGLGVIRPSEGLNYPDGVYNLTPHLDWLEAGKGFADKNYNDEFIVPTSYGAFPDQTNTAKYIRSERNFVQCQYLRKFRYRAGKG